MADWPIALISDIHGNYLALQAVLECIRQKGIRRIICLGDTVGYGPRPVECLREILLSCELVLQGNHDATVADPSQEHRFNPRALDSIRWTRSRILNEPDGDDLVNALGGLSCCADVEDGQVMHAAPSDPLWDYVMPEHSALAGTMNQHFTKVKRICFVGHTHMGGVFKRIQRNRYGFIRANSLSGPYHRRSDRKVLVNVGSVGQPRDGDPRACFVVWNRSSFEYCRVGYDAAAVRDEIRSIKELPANCGDRLLTAR